MISLRKLNTLPDTVKVALLAALFIIVTVIIGIYADSSVYDLSSSNTGAPTGRGIQNFEKTFVQYDGGNYVEVVNNGYTTHSVAFFPLYPISIRALSNISGLSPGMAALVINWFFSIVAAVLIFLWARFELKKRSEKVSPWAVLLLLAVYPTSFYFTLAYTEGMFITLIVASLYAFRTEKYVLAGVFGALAATTKVQGTFIAAFFFFEFCRYWYIQKKPNLKMLLSAAGPAIGLAVYMSYLYVTFGNAFAFIAAQHDWNRLASNPVVGLIKTFKPPYLWYLPLFAAGLWATLRYLGKSWFLWGCLLMLVPIATGSFDSLNRYMMAFVPMFLALALWFNNASPKIKMAYIITSSMLLMWGILLFFNGYWVG